MQTPKRDTHKRVRGREEETGVRSKLLSRPRGSHTLVYGVCERARSRVIIIVNSNN